MLNGSKKKAPKNGHLETSDDELVAKNKIQKVLSVIQRNTEEKRRLKEYAKRIITDLKML